MIESKSWNWDIVDKNDFYWNSPAPEVFYLAENWKSKNLKSILDGERPVGGYEYPVVDKNLCKFCGAFRLKSAAPIVRNHERRVWHVRKALDPYLVLHNLVEHAVDARLHEEWMVYGVVAETRSHRLELRNGRLEELHVGSFLRMALAAERAAMPPPRMM